MKDPWTLHFPVELVEIIGLSKNEIAFLKKKGCPFHGRKTCVAWVRDFLAKSAGGPSQPLPGHPLRTAENKSHGQGEWSDSPAASLGSR
jgi:hypothetical protein